MSFAFCKYNCKMVEKSQSYMHQALTKGCKFLIILYFRCSHSSTSFEEDAWLSTGIFCFTKVAIANDRAISVNANYDRCHNFATATKNPFSDHDLRGFVIRPNLIAHCLPTPARSRARKSKPRSKIGSQGLHVATSVEGK